MYTLKKLVFTFVSLGVFAALLERVSAQGVLPKPLQDIFDLFGPKGIGAASFLSNRIALVLFLFLGAVVLVAVFYALSAAIKYIRSEGDPGKIEEAQKAIKAIFMGIAALFIGIVGIILVFVFFNVNVTDPSLEQLYLQAASSNGAVHCREKGTEDPTGICQYCIEVYKQADAANAESPAPGATCTGLDDGAGDGILDEIRDFVAATKCPAGLFKATEPTNAGRNCVDPSQGGVLPDI